MKRKRSGGATVRPILIQPEMSKIVVCEKCGAMVQVLIDCTCENCGIKCCGAQMKEISEEEANKRLANK